MTRAENSRHHRQPFRRTSADERALLAVLSVLADEWRVIHCLDLAGLAPRLGLTHNRADAALRSLQMKGHLRVHRSAGGTEVTLFGQPEREERTP